MLRGLIHRKMGFILTSTFTLAFALMIAGGPKAYSQTCSRTKQNLPVQNVIDLNNTTITYVGGYNFRIHWVYVSDPSITLICADSGQYAPCGFDGVFYRSDESSHIVSESDGGACNLKTDFTTDGGTFVLFGFELRFELNGVPSKELFGGFAGLNTDTTTYYLGTPYPLSQKLL